MSIDAGTLARLYDLLRGALSADAGARQHAEAELSACAASPGAYMASLALLASHPQAEAEVVQLALVLLKQATRHGWEGAGPMQAVVRERLPALLGHALPRVRVAAAVAIAAIAEHDWPDKWPSLFDTLGAQLRSADALLAHGALRCVEIVAGELDEAQLPAAFGQEDGLLLTLTRIAGAQAAPGDDAASSNRLRRRALSALCAIVEQLAMVVHSDSGGPPFAQPAFAQWTALYLQHAHAYAQPGGAHAAGGDGPGAAGVLMAHSQLLSLLVQHFPRQPLLREARAAHALLGAAWGVLAVAARRSSEPRACEGVDSDGGEQHDGALLLVSLELLGTLTEARPFRGLVLSSLEQLFAELLSLMRVTPCQAAEWEADLPAFLEADAEDSLAYSVRVAAAELAHDQLDRFGERALVAMLGVVRAQLQASAEARARAPGEEGCWWPQAESALYGLQLCARGCRRVDLLGSDAVAQQSGVRLEALVSGALPSAAAIGQPLFVRARAFSLAGTLAERMGAEQRAGWLQLATAALGEQPGVPSPVHFSAARALTELSQAAADARELHADGAVAALLALAALLGGGGGGGLEGDALCALVEAIGLVLTAARACPAAAARVASPLAEALCGALRLSLEPVLWAACTDALELLMLAGEDAHASVARALLPTLRGALERAARARAASASAPPAVFGAEEGEEEAAVLPLVLQPLTLLVRTAPHPRGAGWEQLRAQALAMAPRALSELRACLHAASAGGAPGGDASPPGAGGPPAQLGAARLDGGGLDSARACARCLVALLGAGVLEPSREPQLVQTAVAALSSALPEKALHAVLPLPTALLVGAARALGAPGAGGADAASRVLQLASLLAERLRCAEEPSACQALCHAFARLGFELARRELEGEAQGRVGVEPDLGRLSACAGSRLFSLLDGLPTLSQQRPAVEGSGEPAPPAAALPAVLEAWCSLAPLLAGCGQRRLSALVLVGMLSAHGQQLQQHTVSAPARRPAAGGGRCTRAMARESRIAASKRREGGVGGLRVSLAVRLLQVALELLREEAALHRADAADAAQATRRRRAAAGAADGARAWSGGGEEGSSGDSSDDDDDGGEGEDEGEEDEGGMTNLSDMLQADSAFDLDALGTDDELVDPRAPAERALASMSLGPFLAAFVHSLARSAPGQLQAYLDDLDEEDRRTVQQTLEGTIF